MCEPMNPAPPVTTACIYAPLIRPSGNFSPPAGRRALGMLAREALAPRSGERVALTLSGAKGKGRVRGRPLRDDSRRLLEHAQQIIAVSAPLQPLCLAPHLVRGDEAEQVRHFLGAGDLQPLPQLDLFDEIRRAEQ